ncbi:hypothetical protein M404DRAFT_153376, partial [Pisolithus tinctorius Marx 270]
ISSFSDNKHEVRVVISGHRVTLTYNLYSIPEADVPGLTAIMSTVTITVRPGMTLYSLITDYRVLPGRGCLGFGLRRQYSASNDVTSFRKYLKGPDVALRRPRDFITMQLPKSKYLRTHIVDSAYLTKRDDLKDIMQSHGEVVEYVSFDGDPTEDVRDFDHLPKPPVWLVGVTNLTDNPATGELLYVAYGDEPTVSIPCANLCIVVDLPVPGSCSIHNLTQWITIGAFHRLVATSNESLWKKVATRYIFPVH